MKTRLLLFGGIVQILIAVLHVGIFYGISASSTLSANDKILLHIFNAAVLTTVLFFAYVSLFRREDLTKNALGMPILIFIAIFYLQRGLVELVLRGISPIELLLALLIAGLYATVAFQTKKELKIRETGNKIPI